MPVKTPPVRTSVHHGVIEQSYIGNQTALSVKSGLQQLTAEAKRFKSKQKPVLVLIDVTRLDKTSKGARSAGARGMNTLPYDRVAMYGANAFNRSLINLIIMATGKGNSVKMVDARETAMKWLKNHYQ